MKRYTEWEGWGNFRDEQYLVPGFANRIPDELYLRGVGTAFVDMFEEAWREAWKRHVPTGPIALLTICSHAKPYSKSYIHSSIRRELYVRDLLDKIDYVHISNAGIVPASAENDYPFCAYDWDSREASADDLAYHIEATSRRLREWYGMYGGLYKHGVVYLREGAHTIAGARAAGLPWPIVAADPHYNPLPFVHDHDPDDCLVNSNNLAALRTAIRLPQLMGE